MRGKVLVLGGGGFIGSFVTDRLLEKGYSVRVFDRHPKPDHIAKIQRNIEWAFGDFAKIDELEAALESVDAVIHLVSSTVPSSSASNPVQDLETNVIGSLNLLNAMHRSNIRRIIFVSSGGTVYGLPKYLPIDESHQTNPIVAYGISKLAIEKYILLFQRTSGIRSTILRVANPYGERQKSRHNQGVIAAFIRKVLADEMITIWGDGSSTRDYIYVQDVADAFIKALEYNGNYQVFNIGSGVGTSLNELLSVLDELMNENIRRNHLPSRNFDVTSNVLDIKLAAGELDWKPSTFLRDGLTRTIAWIRDQQLNK